jgi:hypothetical protein
MSEIKQRLEELEKVRPAFVNWFMSQEIEMRDAMWVMMQIIGGFISYKATSWEDIDKGLNIASKAIADYAYGSYDKSKQS